MLPWQCMALNIQRENRPWSRCRSIKEIPDWNTGTFHVRAGFAERTLLQKGIGHFRVLKPSLSKKAKCPIFLVKMSFICMRMKNHFHVKGWALNLVLIQRPWEPGKWPIIFLRLVYTGYFSHNLKWIWCHSLWMRLDVAFVNVRRFYGHLSLQGQTKA